jgi:succinate-acetate transporter protein
MPLGLLAVIFVAAVTITLVIVANKKRSEKIRIAAGIIGGVISALSALYIIFALLLFGAV